MSVSSEFAVFVAILFVLALLLARVPVAFALLSAGAVGVWLLEGADISGAVIGRVPYTSVARYVVLVVPMFIAMGIFARRAGLATEAFSLANRYLGRFPGGLGLATVASCAAFAAVSGSSVATVATMGPLSVNEMKRFGYDVRFAAGIVASAGTLGVLIPPSIVLVLYGIITGESIGALLIAGIIPGILSALAYTGAIVWKAKRSPGLVGRQEQLPKGREAGLRGQRSSNFASSDVNPEKLPRAPLRGPGNGSLVGGSGSANSGFGAVVRIAILGIVVLGGIYFGFLTATEAAAVGALLAMLMLLIDSVRQRTGVWQNFRDAITESVSLSTMVFALLVGAGVFTYLIVSAGMPAAFTDWAVNLPVPSIVVVAVLLLVFVPLGMFLDPISMMLIAVPLAYPVVSGFGYDGIWFGILVVKMMEIGLVTPPFGINAYVVAGACEGVSVEDAFRGVMYFLPIDFATVVLLFLFPPLATWLPSLIR